MQFDYDFVSEFILISQFLGKWHVTKKWIKKRTCKY